MTYRPEQTKVDDAAFTPATDEVYPMGAMTDESSTDSVDEGDVGIPRMTADRKLLTRVVGSTDANRLEVSAAGAGHVNLAQVAAATVTAGAGAVAAGTQRVTLASDDPAVASLSVMDDWDESDRAKVNLIAGQAGITAGAGAVAANTPRVTLASDDPVTTSVQLIDDAIIADNAGFTDGTTKLDMAGYIFDETAGTALTENDAAAARVDSKRAQVMVIEDATTRGQRQAVSAAGAASVNLSQLAGNTISSNNGTAGTGTLRAVLATDQSAVTTAGVFSVKIDQTTDGTTNKVAATQATASNLNAQVVGSVAHDGVGTAVNPVLQGGYASAAAPTDVNLDGDAVRAWFLRNGARATVLTAAGALIGGDVTNGLDVDVTRVSGNVAVTNSGLTSLSSALKNEDTASADLDVGFPVMATRKATPANTSNADGDYEFLQMSVGRLWTSTNIDQINGVTPLMGSGNTGTGSLRVTLATDQVALTTAGLFSVKIDQTTDGTTNKVAATQATAANLNAQVVGNIAHDGADSGNPIKVGGKARQTNPTAVADADRADLFVDDLGRLVVVHQTARDLVTDATTTISSTTETTILAAGGAGVFHDLCSVIASNTSATAVRVDFRDDTGGTVRFSLYLPAGDTRGVVLQVPRPQTATNKNWTAQLSGAVTDVRIFAQAVKNV